MKITSSRLLNYYTELRPSPLHGMGVYAKMDIPRGTIWWKARRKNVMLLNREQYFSLQSSHINELIGGMLDIASVYGYYSQKLDSIIICLDNARYVNHSFEPNSGAPENGDPLSSVTLRHIHAGEEITEDYTQYDLCSWCQITCSDPFLANQETSGAVFE